MRYTKDVYLGVNYTGNIGAVRLKKKKVLNSFFNWITENKFIIAILTSITILIVIDLSLVNTFFNLISNL